MATEMQKRAAHDTLANVGRRRPKKKKQILLDAGYSPAIAKNPDIILESKGFKEALADYGLTDELIVGSLVKDIKKKAGKRYNELNLGAEILGLKKADKNGDTTNNIFIFDEQQRDRIARRIIARRASSEGSPD